MKQWDFLQGVYVRGVGLLMTGRFLLSIIFRIGVNRESGEKFRIHSINRSALNGTGLNLQPLSYLPRWYLCETEFVYKRFKFSVLKKSFIELKRPYSPPHH